MKMYGGVKVTLHTLALALVGAEYGQLHTPAYFIPEERDTSITWWESCIK
jgi:hypothetical protein